MATSETDLTEPYRGGCRCGAVRYACSGPARWAAHCHCDGCRRSSGALVSTYAGFALPNFRYLEGSPKIHVSSPGVERAFCDQCGTSLTYRSQRWPDEIHVLTGSLDDPSRLKPSAHVFTKDRLPWMRLADGLPEHWTVANNGPAQEP